MQASRSYSWFLLFLLWFGAAGSVAEIMTGGLLASAGVGPGLWAILGGHLVGVVLLGAVAVIGYREKMPAIMCTRISFGVRGSWLFSLANVVQLLGWTVVLLQQGGRALGGIAEQLWHVGITVPAIVAMGVLSAVWVVWQTMGRYRYLAATVVLLFALAALVSWVLWGHAQTSTVAPPPVTMPFRQAFELSLVMPLSWVPLVADYAHRARSRNAAMFAPPIGYLIGSLWMYGIGFAGALFTGEADPTPMLLAAGFGIVALGVVVISTLVSTCLTVYSAVVSARNVSPALPEKGTGVAVVALGTLMALGLNSDLYIGFLHLIGAVFAPLSAILLADYFLLRIDSRGQRVDVVSLASLALGIGGYAVFSILGNSPAGPSISCIAFTLCAHLALRRGAMRYAAYRGVPQRQG